MSDQAPSHGTESRQIVGDFEIKALELLISRAPFFEAALRVRVYEV